MIVLLIDILIISFCLLGGVGGGDWLKKKKGYLGGFPPSITFRLHTKVPGSFMFLAMEILPSSGFSRLQNVPGKPISLPGNAWV